MAGRRMTVEEYLEESEAIDALCRGETPDRFEPIVRGVLLEIGDTLVEKNRAYGDSALNPVRVFSKADTTEQLRVRIDDKLSRIARGHDYGNEDTIRDLIGYLVLILIAQGREHDG